MSSTNKTINYQLPQFIGTDKPTWLGDVNGAFLTIDTTMKENNNTATTAMNTAQTANTAASQAITSAQNAESTASQANITANNANSNITSLTNKFNFTNISTITNFTASSGSSNIPISGSLNVVTNNDKSIAKIYGYIETTNLANSNGSISVNFNTTLRPSSNITINNAVFYKVSNSSGLGNVQFLSLNINTTGVCSITFPASTTDTDCLLNLLPFLYFMNDFGDK